MKIKIINPCAELQRMGIKDGDIVEATKGSSLTNSMYVDKGIQTGVVWPENYEIVSEETTKTDKQ